MSALRYRAVHVDRRYNDWHYTLGRGYHYMDLDGIEWCRRCWKTFLLVETSTDPNKPTIVLETLARDLGVPSYLLILPPTPDRDGPEAFDWTTEVGYEQLTPKRSRLIETTLRGWAGILHDARCYHQMAKCPWRDKYEGIPLL